jgi:hypothetical protein
VESKYSRVPIREYVYLTLSGEPPSSIHADEVAILPRWVSLSWTRQALDLLERLGTSPGPRLSELIGLLRWLRALFAASACQSSAITTFEKAVIAAGTECLLEELNRLAKPKRGEWHVHHSGTRGARICHTRTPRRALTVSMLANCSLVIQSKYRRKAKCEKILVPFGAPSGQVLNLLHITARDLYWVHFDDPNRYLADRRRRTHLNELEESCRPLFDFIWRRRFELAALIGVSRRQAITAGEEAGIEV